MAKPSVTTLFLTGIDSSSATVQGRVDANGGKNVTAVGFNYGTTTGYGQSVFGSPVGQGGTTFTGTISGLSPNITYHWRAFASNPDGAGVGADANFTTLLAAPTCTSDSHSDSYTSFTLYGTPTYAGGGSIGDQGLVYSDSDSTPTLAEGASFVSAGAGTVGTQFSATLSSLTPGGTYYARAYVLNGSGTTGYGDVFTITLPNYAAPTVTTQDPTDLAPTTATGNGNVSSDGGQTITERGVVWSTSANPTTSDSKATASGTTGAYTASITSLTAGTTYHVRAYAINSQGTSYGTDLTFDVPQPTAATGTGSAFDGLATIVTGAGAATGTGVAFGATGLEAHTATATGASGTGQAFNASARISIAAGNAAGQGIAFNANTRIITGTATTATGTGTAFGAIVSPAVPAGAASGTGTATNAVPQIITSASVAAGTGTAFGAFAILPDQVFAVATTAAGTGTALEPAVQLIVYAIAAEGTGLAYDLPVHFPPFVGNVATTTNPLRRRLTVTVTRPRTATVHT